MTTWTFIYLTVILKIPVAMLLYIVWWAIHQTPEEAEPTPGGDGGSRTSPHPRDRRPRGPRRGPHGSPAPPAPARVRTISARGSRTPGH